MRGSQAGPSGPPARRAMEARQSFTVSRFSQGNWFSSTWGLSWLSLLQGRAGDWLSGPPGPPGPAGLGGASPVVLEVREVVEDVGVRLALGEGEARVGEVVEYLLHVRVDPAGRGGLRSDSLRGPARLLSGGATQTLVPHLQDEPTRIIRMTQDKTECSTNAALPRPNETTGQVHTTDLPRTHSELDPRKESRSPKSCR